MKRLAGYRMMLLALVTAMVAAGAGADTARPTDIKITIDFEGGKAIPEGQLVVHLDDPAGRHPARKAAESDGKATKMSLSLPMPAALNSTSPQQVVAELQRADGWLLARGSAQLESDAPVAITLYSVMY
ncbi:hypothetical protein RAH32_03490 [Paracoccus sp. WLY502]|uniref:hypothetical protein n=1 Tax=Paracoccus yibinensis TaxID=3068891 RepID=UPI002796D36C|nr:hypothetical protein [Paracoccus sp. WLY502]MDQ1899509.1 hypothetical protein [Paracoccus sp. WLY502]